MFISFKGDNPFICPGERKNMKEQVYDFPKNEDNPGFVFYANKVECKTETEYHSHKYIEIAFVAKGEGTHKIGEKTIRCSKGDIFLINYSVSHKFIPLPGNELVIYNCVFLPEFFDYSLTGGKSFQTLSNVHLFRSFFAEDFNLPVTLNTSGNDYTRINRLVSDILAEYSKRDTGYIELIRAYMVEFIIFILRKTGNDDKNSFSKSTYPLITRKIVSYMEENFNDDVTIGDLSVMAFLSPAQLCRVFKQTTGMTTKEFMRKIRIETACRMLSQTRDSIYKISSDVGYKDTKYFTKIFKSYMGISPSEFRKQNTESEDG